MEYTSLVRIIKECKPLYTAVKQLETKTCALNLIDEEWKTKLHDSAAYQEHIANKVKYSNEKVCAKGNATNKYIMKNEYQYNIIVVGEWMIQAPKGPEDETNISFLCRECEPLVDIGMSMQESPNLNLHTSARFFIQTCDPYFCHPCSSKFREHKIPFAKKHWCVTTTHIFDGAELRNEFATIIQKSLSQMSTFHAVLHLRVKSKTKWAGDNYKIVGSAKEMIIFQPSSLVSVTSLNFITE